MDAKIRKSQSKIDTPVMIVESEKNEETGEK